MNHFAISLFPKSYIPWLNIVFLLVDAASVCGGVVASPQIPGYLENGITAVKLLERWERGDGGLTQGGLW